MAHHALRASNTIARERGQSFAGFAQSAYADGSFFDKYTSRDWLPETEAVAALFARFGIALPTRTDWAELKAAVMADGLYNRLCCTNLVMVGVPLFPDRLIPRPL